MSSYNVCVGSRVTSVRGPGLSNRTPTGDPDKAHLLYWASATIIMDLQAWGLISLSKSVHWSVLSCVKLPSTTAHFYTSFLPQHDDFTVARLAWAEETYADGENVTYSLDWISKSFFCRLFCCLWKWKKATIQDQILFYVGSLDDNIDIKESLMDCKFGNILHTWTQSDDFSYILLTITFHLYLPTWKSFGLLVRHSNLFLMCFNADKSICSAVHYTCGMSVVLSIHSNSTLLNVISIHTGGLTGKRNW